MRQIPMVGQRITPWTPELEAMMRAAAAEAGFSLSGVAAAESNGGTEDTAQGGERFVKWVESGHAGEMEYLKRRDASGALLRSGLRVAIPWANSIIVCAFNYSSAEPRSVEPAPAEAGWIGRYAWSGRREQGVARGHGDMPGGGRDKELLARDYHEELLGRLRVVETRLQEEVECQTCCYVDTGPIVERGFASAAGIGWIGKNTCVLNQELGSWLLLGVIVTSLTVPEQAKLDVPADRCGSCTRCIDACPTNALIAPREMDASRCIAYLTIEKKGRIAPELRERTGRHVFGCDICQDVCPWNTRQLDMQPEASRLVSSGMEVRPQLVNPSLEWLAEMDSKTFKRWFKGSPLERTGKKRLHRNVAIAMGNSGLPEFLPRLGDWAQGEDVVLAEAALWAIGRIHSASIGV